MPTLQVRLAEKDFAELDDFAKALGSDTRSTAIRWLIRNWRAHWAKAHSAVDVIRSTHLVPDPPLSGSVTTGGRKPPTNTAGDPASKLPESMREVIAGLDEFKR